MTFAYWKIAEKCQRLLGTVFYSKFLSTEQNSESSKDIKVALPKVKNKESFSDLNEVQTPSVSYLEEHKKCTPQTVIHDAIV